MEINNKTTTANAGSTTSKDGKKVSAQRPPSVGPSSTIAAAFRSGVRRTRSATGSLPQDSANQLRALKVQQQQEATEQSQVPEPTSKVPATEAVGNTEPDVRKICNQENQPIMDRVDTMQQRLQSAMNANELSTSGGQIKFQQLREELDNIKKELLNQEERRHQSSLEFDVRQLRTDLNTLLEERSTVRNTGQQEETQPKREAVYEGQEIQHLRDGQDNEQHQSNGGSQQRISNANEKAENQLDQPEEENQDNKQLRLVQRIKELEALRSKSLDINGKKPKLKLRDTHSRYSRHSKRYSYSSWRRHHDSSDSSDESVQSDHHGHETDQEDRRRKPSQVEVEVEEVDERASKIPFFSREKGPRYPGLATIKPSDETFDRLLSYRYYRLMRLDATRTSRETLDVKKHLKSLELSLKEHMFSGKDPVTVLNFLTRFVEEADTIGMTEAQALVALPKFMMEPAESQFRASRNGARSGGITAFPEAVQYLLRTYATPSVLREAVNAVYDIRQQPNENEMEYSVRLNTACGRCGNAFEEPRKMTFFVNGLLESIRSTVARHRESVPRDELTYQELVSFAKDEGDAHRARFSGLRTIRVSRRAPQERGKSSTRSAHILESQPTTVVEDEEGMGEDILVLPEESVATTDLPTTLESGQSTEQLLITGTRYTPAAPIAYGGKHTTPNRVGWPDRKPTPRQRLICWQCYEHDHTAPKCDAKVSDIPKVVKNYEALTASEKCDVPNVSYKAAKQFIDMLEAEKLTNDLKEKVGENNSQSKN